jgi:transposase
MNGFATKLKLKLSGIIPLLNEKQRRVLAGVEAKSIGRGGIKILSDITGMDRKTIRKGIKDIKLKNKNIDRIRVSGGGRKKITDQNPTLEKVIEELIDSDSRGDPESPLRWTIKSVRNITEFLIEKGYAISHQTVASILHDLEYSLQGNKKTKEGKDNPDRDSQFKYINETVKSFLLQKAPVISVDTKKKSWLEIIKILERSGKRKKIQRKLMDMIFLILEYQKRFLMVFMILEITLDGLM